jgi:ubiquinone/menaquinone biosynthesis C-methylase UbiE
LQKGEFLEDLLQKEAEFWEKFDLNGCQYGKPYWVDLQKADYLKTPKRYLWCNPRIDAILYNRVKHKLFASLPLKASRILDVGCGAGWLSLEMARLGHEVTGIDIAKKRIEIAKKTALSENLSIDYRSISLDDLTDVASFDVVVSYGSLHHFQEVNKAVSKINSLLKPIGDFLLVENSGSFLRDISDFCRKTILRRSETSRSPFEDASTKTLVSAVKDSFKIKEEFYDLAFTKILAELYDLTLQKFPPQLSYPILNFSRVVDRVASGLGFPSGEVVFIRAYKN